MEAIKNISQHIDDQISHVEKLQEDRKFKEAIVECKSIIEYVHNNGLVEKEMQAHNLLGTSYRFNDEYQEALNEFSSVVSIAEKHNLEKNDEYAKACYNAAILLYNVQPPLPQVVTLLEKAIDIRRSIVKDENDAGLSDYRLLLEAFKKVYNL